MSKLQSETKDEKSPMHRGYILVTRTSKFWNTTTAAFNEQNAKGSEMTRREINVLIQILKEIRKRSRSAIEELRILRK